MSNAELEALVGHLFIVGGRSIRAASPGAVAMPPPRRTARGRDHDTFFGLLSLSQEQRQPASFYEDLTRRLSSTFFSVGGSVTAALRQAIAATNAALLEINRQRPDPLTVGLACAVLREQEVYIAVVGGARCFLIHEGEVERLPADDELEFDSGLGVEAEPDVHFYHRSIRADDFLMLADTSLNHLRDGTLLHAVESGEVDTALNNLAAVAGQFSTALVIKFVAPLAEGAEEALSQPPARHPIIPPPPDYTAAGRQSAAPTSGAATTAVSTPQASQPTATAAPLPLVRKRPQGLARNAALGMAALVGRVRLALERIWPAREAEDIPAQHRQLSTPMQIGVVLAVTVIVALVTTAVYRFRGQTSQYAQLVREAQREIELARAAGENQAEARPHWETALFLLDRAAAIRRHGAEIGNLRAEALAVLDSYDHVTRVTPTLLRTYEPGAYLRGPVVQGLNIYLIDSAQDILYREDLDENGTRLLNPNPQIITRQGELASNQAVGGLIDLIWMEESGAPQRNVLGVLSRNGLLITYSPSVGLSATLLPGFEAWSDPRAIALYERDLYILDAGAGEIWRYEARSGGYTTTPQRYFTDVTPDLFDAVDMEIDTNGNVYILHGSGRISKFFFGRPQTFAFTGLPQPLAHPTAMFLSLSPYDRTLFITDAGGGRLYATAPSGTFIANYKDTQDVIFDALSGVYYQDRPPYVYVTAGNQLYYFSRP